MLWQLPYQQLLKHCKLFYRVDHCAQGSLFLTSLFLIPSTKCSRVSNKMWNEITYPFPTVQRFLSFGIDKLLHPMFYEGCDYLSILGLSHWGRVTPICVFNPTIIGSDNGLSPGRRQAIICTSAGILSIGPLGRNFGEHSIKIHISSLKKMHLKMSSGK